MNTEAIFTQIAGLVAELRRKNENEKKNEHMKPVNWVLLPIRGREMVRCDGCYTDIKGQYLQIAVTNDSKKVLCEKCWEIREEASE